MPHILDNMIWNAITTGNSGIADVHGTAGAYFADIAPFAALESWTPENWQHLHQHTENRRTLAVAFPETGEPDGSAWEVIRRLPCNQMVYEYPVHSFTTPVSKQIVPLTEKHVPEMLELTALTKPGPFLQKTIQFGHYYGIFENGQLAAMAGQRMHPVPYLEVSAVCTHPDFRGKGYAKAVMLHVMQVIVSNGFIPFLHVLSANSGAIQLYESIGYRTRKQLDITMIRKK